MNESNSMSLRPGATADCKSGVQETLNDVPEFFPSLSYTTLNVYTVGCALFCIVRVTPHGISMWFIHVCYYSGVYIDTEAMSPSAATILNKFWFHI